MIVFYLGEDEASRPKYLELFKDYPVLQIGREQIDMDMKDIIQLEQKDIGDITGDGESFLYWVDEEPKSVTDMQKVLHEHHLDIDAMAIETENNLNWKFSKLYDEVSKEAAYFKKRDKLMDLIMAADKTRLAKEENYQKCVMSCWSLLQQDECPERLLDLAIEMLDKANKNI